MASMPAQFAGQITPETASIFADGCRIGARVSFEAANWQP
jgi:hypothetical protein